MFITFEGPEGCGKTTQLPALADYLRQSGHEVILTREPGGTVIGDQVRTVLLSTENTTMLPRTEILLFQASRAQLVEEVIRPQLARGCVVLCDRFADSTIAYQGYGYRQDLMRLHMIVDFAVQGLIPDLTVLLDLDVEVGLRRKSGDGQLNRLDAYELDFHRRVRRGYHQLAAQQPERWVTIDAGRPLSEVQADIRQVVLSRLG